MRNLFGTKVLSRKEFRDALRDELLTIGYFGVRLGRKPHHVLGKEKHQITKGLALQVGILLLKKFKSEGRVLDVGAKDLEEHTGLKLFVNRLISDMAKFNWKVSSTHDVKAFADAAGDLLMVGLKGSRDPVYITTMGAPPLFVTQFRDVVMSKAADDAKRNDARVKIVERYLAAVQGTDLTVEDAYAKYCESYQLPKAS